MFQNTYLNHFVISHITSIKRQTNPYRHTYIIEVLSMSEVKMKTFHSGEATIPQMFSHFQNKS